jgi:3-oxoacyl-[acyl-carrier protein] reductase
MRRVLITGGSGGLGRAIAHRFCEQGDWVGLVAQDQAALEQSAQEIGSAGGRVWSSTANVLESNVLQAAVDAYQEWAGGLDVLVCAAGRLQGIGPIDTVDPGVWWDDLRVSVQGFLNTTRAALPILRRSTNASIMAIVGPGHDHELPFATGYAAGQAALVRLVESLASELSETDIRVYAVHPGLVPTPWLFRLVETDQGRRWLPRFNEALAEGKEVEATVVADAVVWLAQSQPVELTGRVVPAPATPPILETRLSRIQSNNLGVLRLR